MRGERKYRKKVAAIDDGEISGDKNSSFILCIDCEIVLFDFSC